MRKRFRVGDRVIYRKHKHSTHPGPRAEDIYPAPHGEDYSYQVDKFWVVQAVQPNGKILVRTRRGKLHEVEPDDPALRRASWWELLVYRRRFPELGSSDEPA